MDKFAVDFNSLVPKIDRPKEYRLADVQDKIEKVAFDVVRFRDADDTEQLWKIEQREDGPVIVALYDENTGTLSAESSNEGWQAIPDKKAACVHLYYKGEPIVKLAAKDLSIPADEVNIAARWIPEQLVKDSDFRSHVLRMANDPSLSKKFPELNKTAKDLRIARIAEKIKAAS